MSKSRLSEELIADLLVGAGLTRVDRTHDAMPLVLRLMAQAWDEGRSHGAKDMQGCCACPNPYRVLPSTATGADQ